VLLTPKAAQDFALIVHELATNATKHGALSETSGRIVVDCAISVIDHRQMLVFEWREEGGGPVRRPKQRGFGSVILESAPSAYAHEVKLEFAPSGIRYRLVVELARIAAKMKAPGSRTEAATV
jgi:two-component sensor histidine kinase